LPQLSESSLLGDGQDKDPLPLVGRSHVGRSKRYPFRIEPDFGKPSEYDSSSGISDNCRHILDKDPSGLHLANDAEVFKPESRVFSGDAGAFPGDGQVGARESAHNEIHCSTPRVAIEGGNVRKDGCWLSRSIGHARRQDLAGREFPLHVTECSNAW